MKKYRVFTIWILFLLLFRLSMPAFATEGESTLPSQGAAPTEASHSTPVDSLPSGFEPPAPLKEYNFQTELRLKAKSAALVELNSNAIVYGQELDRQIYPASLTKIMTCMLALEHGDPDQVLTVSETALENLSIYGSTAGLKAGEELCLDELLYCIMVSSANEGCNVVAEYIAGSVESFVTMMNEKAAALGMTNTHFANPHGLHDESHYTTARDLALLSAWAWQNLQFREYASTTTHTVPATNLSEPRQLRTTNFLTDTSVVSRYYYDKAQGIKTGFTTPAGGCLISTAAEGDLAFLSVVCGCETLYDADGDQVDMRFIESRRLLRYGLENFSFVQVLADTQMLEEREVHNGQSSTVILHPADNLSAVLPTDCNLSAITTQVHYDSTQPLQAPLSAGQKVGTVTAVYEGISLVSCDLVTLTAVDGIIVSQDEPIKPRPNTITPPETPQKPWILRYWYVTFPFLLVLLLLCWMLILRAINIHKARVKARRRRERQRRRSRE